MTTPRYDLLVLGSGPAGIHAAVQAAKLRKTVAIVERDPLRLGGAWLHTGTLPSKTMREVLAVIHAIKPHVGPSWVQRIVGQLSMTHLSDRARAVAENEEALVRKHLSNNNVTLLTGSGRLEDNNTVRVAHNGASSLAQADHILIATGSKPRRPSEIPFDDWRIVDSDGILRLEALPRSIMIFGAGVIGCEYACIFGAAGVKTILVDARSQIMQSIDKEITEALRRYMEDMGVRFMLGERIARIEKRGPVVHGLFESGLESSADIFFFAAGRESATHDVGLERVGITTDARGTIIVNEYFQTSVPNIYAAGDVIGSPALACTSAEQGRIAACHALSNQERRFPKLFPVGIYTIPELSSVGKSEEELNKEGVDYVAGRANFDEIARGVIRGDTHGMLKLLACARTHKILGLHIVGPDAANLIHIGLGFMLAETPLEVLVDSVIFNYPTLAEAYRVAAFNALNKIRSSGMIDTAVAMPVNKDVKHVGKKTAA